MSRAGEVRLIFYGNGFVSPLSKYIEPIGQLPQIYFIFNVFYHIGNDRIDTYIFEAVIIHFQVCIIIRGTILEGTHNNFKNEFTKCRLQLCEGWVYYYLKVNEKFQDKFQWKEIRARNFLTVLPSCFWKVGEEFLVFTQANYNKSSLKTLRTEKIQQWCFSGDWFVSISATVFHIFIYLLPSFARSV